MFSVLCLSFMFCFVHLSLEKTALIINVFSRFGEAKYSLKAYMVLANWLDDKKKKKGNSLFQILLDVKTDPTKSDSPPQFLSSLG